jgi:hypothetical protein
MTVSDADALIREVRDEFPAPISILDHDMFGLEPELPSYCVGGALCRFYGCCKWNKPSFPLVPLRTLLLKLNKSLSMEPARIYVHELTRANDTKEFEDAWTIMRNALCYPINPNEVTNDTQGST